MTDTFSLLIGTRNPGKLREYRDLLAEAPVKLVGLDEAGVEGEVEEPHDTFIDNAKAKALGYAKAGGMFALADDSGLCVDALDGAPGVLSARYGGPGLDDRGRRLKLLDTLQDVPDGQRGARFVCVIAVANPETGAIITAEGEVTGHIDREERDGPAGFGYDPVFVPAGYSVSFAQMPEADKNRLSHRGRAAEALLPLLKALVHSQGGG